MQSSEKLAIDPSLSTPSVATNADADLLLTFARPVGPQIGTQERDLAFYRRLRDDPLFCHVCTNLDKAAADALSDGDGPWVYVHHLVRAVLVKATVAELFGTAAAGCCSCLLVKECALRLFGGLAEANPDYEVTMTYRAGDVLTVTMDTEDETSLERTMEIFTLDGQSSPWAGLGSQIMRTNPVINNWPSFGGSARLISETASVPACFDRIKAWNAECEQDHPYCSNLCGPPFRAQSTAHSGRPPRRLVCVGKSKADLRLEEVSGGRAPTYAALSYCWGQSKHLVCTRENYAQLLCGIIWRDLPKTIQDAIEITRGLGIGHLWVDALCIIQRDAEDWQMEAANMASIYGNAYLTIAATAAKDCGVGCFLPRPQALKIDLVENSGDRSTVYARRLLDHTAFDWADPRAFEEAVRNRNTKATVDHTPLFERGWCFQERLLSNRILHYSAGELVWECLGMVSCECGTLDRFVGNTILRERRHAAGVPPDVEVKCGKLDRALTLAKHLDFVPTSHELPSVLKADEAFMFVRGALKHVETSPSLASGRRWLDLIHLYSQKQFTYDTDRLAALSGLAQCWQSLNTNIGTYFAGIWDDVLLEGLLWKCTDMITEDRPKTALAPSWSWASVRRAVDFISGWRAREMSSRVTILSVECRPAGSNKYGDVSYGHVRLRGRTVTKTLTSHETAGMDNMAWVTLDLPGVKGHTLFAFDADSIPQCRRLVGSKVHILWYRTDINNVETGRGFERALVLHECEGKPGVFSRLGVVEYLLYEVVEEMENDESTVREILIV